MSEGRRIRGECGGGAGKGSGKMKVVVIEIIDCNKLLMR